MERLKRWITSVRVRLLVIALLPMVVLLPLMLGGTMWRWSGKIDDILINKVTGDLTIADQYLRRLVEFSGQRLGLDFLYLADAEAAGRWPVVTAALNGRWHSAVDIFTAEDLSALDPALAIRAALPLVPTRGAVPTERSVENRGIVIHSAAPVRLPGGGLAALVGGTLLNQNLGFIDTINDLVYREQSLPEGSQGTATLFLEDVRVSTNVRLFENVRALGTRVSAEVRAQVLDQGRIWLDRAFVVNDWYISAYEPIVDSFGQRVGMLYVGFLETPFREAKRNSALALTGAFLLIALMSIPIFLRWAGRIFLPLEGMNRTMAQVEAGDLQARNNVDGHPDEITQVAAHLDTLLDQVQARDRELRDWAESLEAKVEERTADLREANRQIERTTERLIMSEKLATVGEITASVAHEINNPVAVIQGNLDLARSILGEGAAPVREEFRLIDDQVYRISVIVSKLLQFARPEDYSGARTLIVPADVARDCLVLTRRQLEAAGIRVETRFDSAGQVSMSRTELQQVIVNLVLNAVHAMPEGGVLSVGTEARDGHLVITLADTGTGMPPEVLSRIFDPFFTTKQAQGTGLGLSISQQLVGQVGGRISARSEPGKGTRFEISLPLAPGG